MLTAQKERAVPGPIEDSSHQITTRSVFAGEHPDFNEHSAGHQALRQHLARSGLQMSLGCGAGIVLTGAGFAKLAPDMRAVRLLARCLGAGGVR